MQFALRLVVSNALVVLIVCIDLTRMFYKDLRRVFESGWVMRQNAGTLGSTSHSVQGTPPTEADPPLFALNDNSS
jgi:hypothetical protein